MLAAAAQIRPHLTPSPLRRHPALDQLLGAQVHVKHENLNPTGAFKVRGGLNLVSRLSPAERARGVIAASTGNHGQSVAYAARLFGAPAIVCAPSAANPVKVAAMEALGAEVVQSGATYDEARRNAERLAAEGGHRYIHSGDEPDLIAGVATLTLEVLLEEPGIEVILVPIGGGTGAAGACIVAKALNPAIEVIGVQSAQAPAAYLSWKEGRLTEAPNRTTAEGLSTGSAFRLPQAILREHLDGFLLAGDDEIDRATRLMIEATRMLIEGAGAAALAGALQIQPGLKGRKVALIASGGNISSVQLERIFAPAAPLGG